VRDVQPLLASTHTPISLCILGWTEFKMDSSLSMQMSLTADCLESNAMAYLRYPQSGASSYEEF